MNTTSILRPAALVALGLLTQPTSYVCAQSIHAEFWGPYPNDIAGSASARIGDINNDGFAEYLLAAPGFNSGPGRVYVVDGQFHYNLRIHDGPSNGSMTGGAVAGGVDWNNDGVPDYAVGFPRVSVGALLQAGMVRIYSGKDGSLIQSFFGNQAGMRLGEGLCFLGDVNGDGRVDLAVGAPGYVGAGGHTHGLVRIYSGMSGMPIVDAHGAHVPNSGFGRVLTPVGDWNGDGAADFAAGFPDYQDEETSPGMVQVISGTTGQYLTYFMPTVPGSHFGYSIATLPDRDGDGKPELLIGAPKESGLGAVRLVSSATKQTLSIWYGQTPGSQFGYAMGVVGDVDQDGTPDFAVTSPFMSGESMRIFSGATGQTLWQPLQKPAHLSSLGATLTPLGDHDGDGWLDILLTDASSYASAPLGGAAAVVRAALHHPNLGFGGPGNSKLSVHGKPLAAGGYADLKLTTAGANRPGLLFASLGSSPMPIAGGTLVPNLGGLMIPFVTDDFGRMELKGIPGGLGMISLYTQAVVVNPSQPQGYGFSNAVRIDFQQ